MNIIHRYYTTKRFEAQKFPPVIYPTTPTKGQLQNENGRKLGFLISLRYGTELTPKNA